MPPHPTRTHTHIHLPTYDDQERRTPCTNQILPSRPPLILIRRCESARQPLSSLPTLDTSPSPSPIPPPKLIQSPSSPRVRSLRPSPYAPPTHHSSPNPRLHTSPTPEFLPWINPPSIPPPSSKTSNGMKGYFLLLPLVHCRYRGRGRTCARFGERKEIGETERGRDGGRGGETWAIRFGRELSRLPPPCLVSRAPRTGVVLLMNGEGIRWEFGNLGVLMRDGFGSGDAVCSSDYELPHG
ncbi:hypothetical protein BDP67DRAFT_521099 [Colletotrichum lupini]|nr:hypothetical protein BDP67DRAFT_521099 [Colletotrichum lupini]